MISKISSNNNDLNIILNSLNTEFNNNKSMFIEYSKIIKDKLIKLEDEYNNYETLKNNKQILYDLVNKVNSDKKKY